MQKMLFAIILFFLAGCSTTDVLVDDKGAIITNGRIVRKVGQANCRITLITDQHGIFDTGTLNLDECERYHEGDRVRIKIFRGQPELMYPLERCR
jgi:hypothetical protein